VSPVIGLSPSAPATPGRGTPSTGPRPPDPGRRRLTEREAEQIRQDRVTLWAEAEQRRRFDRKYDLEHRIGPAIDTHLTVAREQLQLAIERNDSVAADRIEQAVIHPLEQRRADVEDELSTVLGEPYGTVIEVSQDLHATLNNDYAVTVSGGVDTISALTGTGEPPPVEASRGYGYPAGHRQPVEYDQQVLEDLIPRHDDGRPQRLPNPFASWFQKMNDSGPGADPTRGINCVDCVLSLFDTWVHGRPRVSAPRTFDAYQDGDVRRPLYGELGGFSRARMVLGTDFTTTYTEETATTDDPQTAFEERLHELERSLLEAGPGSFAMINHEWRDGGGHSWAAVNYENRVVYLDPQLAMVSERPLYNTLGPRGAVRLDVAMVDGAGRPVRLVPDRLQPPWRAGEPTGGPDPTPLRERMLDPYDGAADLAAAYPDSPTPPPPPQPWDGWKAQEGAAWRDRSVATIASQFHLADDPAAVATLTVAYELTRDHIAPFVLQVASQMLVDFRTSVAENPDRRIAFVGRDGDSLALAVRQLDGQFFAAHCTQITLSRKLAMSAVLDAEAQRRRILELDGALAREADVRIAPEGFRWDFRSDGPQRTDGALGDLIHYLESRGFPLADGGAVTLVDSSFKGTVQAQRPVPARRLLGRVHLARAESDGPASRQQDGVRDFARRPATTGRRRPEMGDGHLRGHAARSTGESVRIHRRPARAGPGER
jgi:hypothetical protein